MNGQWSLAIQNLVYIGGGYYGAYGVADMGYRDPVSLRQGASVTVNAGFLGFRPSLYL